MDLLKDEFLDILSRYQGILHKVCLVYFNNDEDRKDNFQEIVFQLWKSFPKLKDHNKIASWIYAVSINTSISKIRVDSRFRTSDIESLNDKHPAFHLENDSDEYNMLMSAINRLNESDKAIILLHLDGLSYEEIAEITGISKSNVGVKINRAKKTLKQYLNN